MDDDSFDSIEDGEHVTDLYAARYSDELENDRQILKLEEELEDEDSDYVYSEESDEEDELNKERPDDDESE